MFNRLINYFKSLFNSKVKDVKSKTEAITLENLEFSNKLIAVPIFNSIDYDGNITFPTEYSDSFPVKLLNSETSFVDHEHKVTGEVFAPNILIITEADSNEEALLALDSKVELCCRRILLSVNNKQISVYETMQDFLSSVNKKLGGKDFQIINFNKYQIAVQKSNDNLMLIRHGKDEYSDYHDRSTYPQEGWETKTRYIISRTMSFVILRPEEVVIGKIGD